MYWSVTLGRSEDVFCRREGGYGGFGRWLRVKPDTVTGWRNVHGCYYPAVTGEYHGGLVSEV